MLIASLYPVCAVLGNWWKESNINPGIWENLTPGAPGYGLGQWTAGRRDKLFAYLDSNGFARDDGNGQLEYFIVENTWYRNGWGDRFSSLSNFLTSDSSNLTILTYAFMQGWEGIWNGTQDERAGYSKQCYEYIVEHAEDPAITTWVTGNRYLSTSEILNNAVLAYRYLTGGAVPEPGPGPDPGPPPDPDYPLPGKARSMPVYMMTRSEF